MSSRSNLDANLVQVCVSAALTVTPVVISTKGRDEWEGGREVKIPHPTSSCKSSLEAWLISGTSVLPEGPAVRAQAPPTSKKTPQREKTNHTTNIPKCSTHMHHHTHSQTHRSRSTYRRAADLTRHLSLAVDCGAALCRLNSPEKTLPIQPHLVNIFFSFFCVSGTRKLQLLHQTLC